MLLMLSMFQVLLASGEVGDKTQLGSAKACLVGSFAGVNLGSSWWYFLTIGVVHTQCKDSPMD